MVRKKLSSPCKKESSKNVHFCNLDEGESSNFVQNNEIEIITLENGLENNEESSDVYVDEYSTILPQKLNTTKHNSAKKGEKKFKGKDSHLDLQLQNYLKNCDFYITVYMEMQLKQNLQHKLGQFIGISSDNNVLVELATVPVRVVYLYVSEEAKNFFLYWERSDEEHQLHVFYCPVECNVSYVALKGIEIKKNFVVILKEDAITLGTLVFEIYLNPSAFFELHYSCEPIRTPAKRGVQNVMGVLYGITSLQYPYMNISLKPDIEGLYHFLSNIQQSVSNKENENVCSSSLIPVLRPYQENAVRWMLRQERGLHKQKENFHPLFLKIDTKDGRKVYYNKYGGFYTLQKPATGYQPQGGILADEMGLGKTIEVLACLLNNPRSLPDCNSEMTVIDKVKQGNREIRKESYPSNNSLADENIQNESFDTDLNDDSCASKQHNRRKRLWKRISSSNKRRHIACLSRFESEQNYLECLCGEVDNCFDYKEQVQCEGCALWQHIDCIEKKYQRGYDASQKHYCPHCWVSMSKKLYSSRATLIITPACISYQWEEEIEKHINAGSLKVLVYNGVQTCFIPPSNLMDYDIVLTTYNVLRKEINYVDLLHPNNNSRRKFRYRKRFMAIPSPLLCIEWWRVCLDEAQMVESTTTKTAEMAQRLAAVNRWCVTGTPIQKTVDDLYGLLLFLGIEPYCVKWWWKETVLNPYCNGNFQPLLEVLNTYFWRTVKKDVLDQIGIPKQEEEIHWLSFSPVEEHFYYRKHQECSQEVTHKISKFTNLDIKLSSLDRHAMTQLLYPLRRLRQACCHPQAVRGEFLPIHKSTLTMEELLESLIKKVKNECEESHRQSIAAINGIAAIHIINKEFKPATEKYREVLKLVEDHASHIKTDKLQQLHTLHNLAEILEGQISNKLSEAKSSAQAFVIDNQERYKHHPTNNCRIPLENGDNFSTTDNVSIPNLPEDIGRTLRDDNLRYEASKLRELYLSKCLSQVKSSEDQLTSAMSYLKEFHTQFLCKKDEPWWFIVIKHSIKINKDSVLVQKIKEDLMDKKVPGMLSAVHKFHDVRGMQYVIACLLNELQESHDLLSAAVKKLSTTPSASDVSAAVDCHLRPLGQNKLKCIYCQIHELFNHYESKLFYFGEDVAVVEPTKSDIALLEPLRRGTWADSELELMLKLMLTFAKSHKAETSAIEDGNLHLKLFEGLKKEFRALRGVWMQIRDYASAVDELDMATLRFRIRYKDEPQPEIPVPYILERDEVEYTRLKLMSEMVVSKNELRKKLGQLFYLQNLAKADFGRKGGSNPDSCPICRHVLGVQWNVLQCGHCFCVSCIHMMLSNYLIPGRHRAVRCPVCRQLTSNAEISFVNTTTNDDSKIPVKGSHSTKIEGVVRCLLHIKSHDQEAKVLVFSMWQDVLDVLAHALTENEITYIDLHSRPGLVENLTRFRMEAAIMALLLPIRSGANGLNLIEASHVILVEPVLNSASEQQAIGRVHRIGQTRQTTVHRFVVRKTIEEKMHYMLQIDQTSTTVSEKHDHDITLRKLQELFVHQ